MGEFSRFSGPSQLLYKGDNTFNLLDCARCKIIFEVDRDKVSQVQRVYQDTVTFQKSKSNEVEERTEDKKTIMQAIENGVL